MGVAVAGGGVCVGVPGALPPPPPLPATEVERVTRLDRPEDELISVGTLQIQMSLVE